MNKDNIKKAYIYLEREEDKRKDKFKVALITFILLLVVFTSIIYLALQDTSNPKYICKSKGYDYYGYYSDKVYGVKYLKCCTETIGEDVCGWVKKNE